MPDVVMQWLIKAGVAVAIFIVGLWIAARIKSWLGGIMRKRGADPMLASFLSSLAHILLVVFVIVAALSQLGIQTTSLIAIIGAAGLAIGLALQNSLSNFAAGVMIVAFRPFKVGDYVEAAGIAGTVELIQIFNTRLLTPDNRSIIVPNGNIINGNIINYSAKDIRRVDLAIGISYGDDIARAKQILHDLLESDARVLDDPAPTIAVSALADSSVNLIFRPWVKTADYWFVYWDLTEAAKLRFDEEGITIPFPQRELHVQHLPGQGAAAAG